MQIDPLQPLSLLGTSIPLVSTKVIFLRCLEEGIDLSNFCYLGNHLNDLGRLEAFGWPATPKDANPIAIAKAVIVSSKNGGKGAVREISKIILAQMPDDEGKGAPMTKPIFLLGVGAQKAGTSWLHAYLQSLPEVDLGFMKEYHVFDQGHVSNATPNRATRVRDYLNSFFGSGEFKMLYKFRRNHKHYMAYFRNLVQRSDQVFITGDITPFYAALPANVFEYVKSSLEANGFRVKVIFLMRDPVARCISANRMYSSQRLLKSPGDAALEAALLEKKHQQIGFQIRTRYDLTIGNLEQVFTPDELFIGFYEELFSDRAIAEICDFLELPFRAGNYEQVVHGSPVKSELPEAAKSLVRNYYSEVYDFVINRFGQDRVRNLWKLK